MSRGTVSSKQHEYLLPESWLPENVLTSTTTRTVVVLQILIFSKKWRLAYDFQEDPKVYYVVIIIERNKNVIFHIALSLFHRKSKLMTTAGFEPAPTKTRA